jgi:translation initiation factor 1 (eIF-1/SUI1)
MPFNIGGDWIEKSKPAPSKKPVKIVLEKRKNLPLTVVYNLPMDSAEMTELGAVIKRKLGCGGMVKEGKLSIQGSKVFEVQEFLRSQGIKV